MKFVMKYFEELTIYCPNPNISKMHCLTFKIDSIVYAIKLLNALINTKKFYSICLCIQSVEI